MTPVFGSVISMDRFESICNVMHFNKNDNIGTTRNHLKFSKSIQSCPISTRTLLERKKMIKCHIKLFRRLLNIAVLNCMVICRENARLKHHFKFSAGTIYWTCKWKCQEISRPLLYRQKCAATCWKAFSRNNITDRKKTKPTERCVVCYKSNRRKETVFWCPECEAALCVEECFKAFHTKLHF